MCEQNQELFKVNVRGTLVEVLDILVGEHQNRLEIRLEIYKGDQGFYGKVLALTTYLLHPDALPEGQMSQERLYSEYYGLIHDDNLVADNIEILKEKCLQNLRAG